MSSAAAPPRDAAPLPPPDPARARAYARIHFRLGLLSTALDLVILVLALLLGWSLGLERWVRLGLALQSPWVVVLAYTVAGGIILKLVGLPLSLVGRQVEIRFEMNRQSWGGWLKDELKSIALEAAFGLGAVELIYWLLRAHPHYWWLWAWAAFATFVVVMAQLAPVVLLPLFFNFRPLSPEDPDKGDLVRRLEALCARASTKVKGVFEWELGSKTVKANAALTGWGATRRIIVSDTLLTGSPAEEIEAVLAHELGHHVHRHILRALVLQTAISLLGFWLANVVMRALARPLHLSGIADIAGLPLFILVVSILSLLLLPLLNAISRHAERQADDYSFTAMGSAQPLIAGLERLAAKNLAEVQPPRWKEVLFYSHPSIATRVARGKAWEAAHASRREG